MEGVNFIHNLGTLAHRQTHLFSKNPYFYLNNTVLIIDTHLESSIWINYFETEQFINEDLIHESIFEYGLEMKGQRITLDNIASNTIFMDKLESLMESIDKDFSSEDMHFRCISHILNLGAQDLLVQLKLESDADLKNYDEIDDEECETELEIPVEEKKNVTSLNKLRTLFLKLKYSNNLRRKLKCCCGTVGIEMLSPSIDVSTRWYSAFDMIVKGIKLEKSLILLCYTDSNILPLQRMKFD